MKNREIYTTDPLTRDLRNNGVAKVSDGFSPEELATLRYELETFVCEGEYERGLNAILQSFLGKLDGEQNGVWISGFFGSGKSHLAKVLRSLWVDFEFPEDGAKARGLTSTSQRVEDHLVEVTRRGRGFGRPHAASGTLGSGAGDKVRLALLSIVFRSVGLPPDYPQARFVMWLMREGLLEQVRKFVEDAGRAWESEVDNMKVSKLIPEAILDAVPDYAENE